MAHHIMRKIPQLVLDFKVGIPTTLSLDIRKMGTVYGKNEME